MLKIAKDLKLGDKIKSSSGTILTVTAKDSEGKRSIVTFDKKLEVDFDHYYKFNTIEK